MSINYEVYGAPESWQNCFYAGGSTAAWTTLLHGEKAKVPTWKETHPDSTSYATSQLRYGVADGKIEEQVPIDNSIAAIGQGQSSPFRKWFVYANIADEEHPNGQVRNIGEAYVGADFNDDTTVINTFWYEANNPTAYATYGNAAFSSGLLSLHVLERRTWSPDGENAEGTDRQNGNYYIAPFTSYGTRSFCLQILVFDAGEYNDEYTPGSAAPSGSWRTLDSWKNTYPTHAITAVWFRIRSLSAYNTSTGVMGYNAQNFGSSEYRKIGCGILDTIKFDLDDGTSVPELTDYALFNYSGNNELGVRLFTPHSDLYRWQNNLQNIILYPTEISNYVKSNGSLIVPYVPYSDEFYEYVMRACACFGMPFTPAKSTGTDATSCQFNQEFTDVDLCLPVIDGNGIANGDYTRGTGNLDNDFIDLADIRDKEYDPEKPPAPTPSTDPIYPSTPGFSLAVGNGSVNYIINKEEWKRIWDDIYGGSKSDWKDLIQGLQLYGANPLNAILNYRWYPFTFSSAYTDPLRLGSTIVKPVSHAYNYIGDKAEGSKSTSCSFKWNVDKNFINIRKTKARLWLPFYGFYDIPPTLLIDKELELEFQYNLPNDTGIWFISFDNVIYDYVECQPYIEIPISGDNSTQIAAAKLQRNLQIAGTVAGAAVAIAGGAALAAPGIAALGAATAESAWAFGGGVAGTIAAGAANVGPLISEGFITGATAAGLMGAGGAALATGPKVANTVMQSALRIGTLSTNIPIHSAASDSTFLSLPMYPYLQTFTAEILEGYNSGEYKLKVGIACDVWKTISEMPDDSLLQATGIADTATTNMEITEVQELNSILQSGFYK